MKKVLNILLLSMLCAFMFVQPASAAKTSRKPVIKKVTTTQSSAKIYWKKAKNSKCYYIYRKVRGGKYKKIATVNKKTTVYTDKKIRSGKTYYYKIKSKTSKKSYTSSAKAVKLVKMKTPDTTVKFTNYHAVVKWNSVSKADGYIIYRKYGHGGTYKKIATVKGRNKISYEDIYYCSLSSSHRESLLLGNAYADPTTNGFIYAVKAYRKMKYGTSYSECLRDGDFHMDPPAVVSVIKQSDTNAVIEWGTIKNAQRYSIFSGYIDARGNKVWKKNATINASDRLRQSAVIKVDSKDTYFTVVAEAMKNGKWVSSGFDKGFHIDKREYKEKNILFLGDSITIGRPYLRTADEKEVFTFPWRVRQLTGAQYYNPSVPGATYTSGNQSRSHIVTDIAEKMHNQKSYKDFDVVVLSAGTNDYMKNVELGNLNSSNPHQFYGALNKIMGWIKEGSDERVAEGKTPIKVVFIELFYAQRAYQGGRFAERYTQPNGKGLTLKDYQNALDRISGKYHDIGMDVFHFYTRDIVNSKNCSYVTCDNLHMTRYTYAQIGNRLAEFMMEIFSEDEEQEPVEPIPDESESIESEPIEPESEEPESEESKQENSAEQNSDLSDEAVNGSMTHRVPEKEENSDEENEPVQEEDVEQQKI